MNDEKYDIIVETRVEGETLNEMTKKIVQIHIDLEHTLRKYGMLDYDY